MYDFITCDPCVSEDNFLLRKLSANTEGILLFVIVICEITRRLLVQLYCKRLTVSWHILQLGKLLLFHWLSVLQLTTLCV